MTQPWDGATSLPGQKIELYDIVALREFVGRVNTNYWTMEDPINFEDL